MAIGKTAGRLALAAILTMAIAAPVSAGGAVATTIEITVVGEVETFTTTGGLLCPAGTATTYFHHLGGGPGMGVSFHGAKLLDCYDGSGTFVITFNAATHFGSPQDQGGWRVVEGSGDYEGLKGGGNLVGTYTEDGIIDLYTGRVTLP
jgi:hypothetical protein